jgi:hypothetical protein
MIKYFIHFQEDEFHFTYFHVGEIRKIRIGHNRTELGMYDCHSLWSFGSVWCGSVCIW